MATRKIHKPSGWKPAHTIRAGAIQATIWENAGALGPFYAATLSRSYRGASGNWRQGTSLAHASWTIS
jgi:hypothetical protein